MTRQQAHIEKLAKQIGAKVSYVQRPPMTTEHDALYVIQANINPDNSEVQTLLVTSDIIYALALHELGHIAINDSADKMPIDEYSRCYHYPQVNCFERVVREEAAAWKWAHANALYWNEEMAAIEQEGFGSYTDNLKKLQTEPEQIRRRRLFMSQLFGG